jgi:hypothetical protein
MSRFRVRAADTLARGFSRQHGITHFTSLRLGITPHPHSSKLQRDGFTCHAGYMLTPGQPPPGLSYPPASPHHSPTTPSGPPHPPTATPRRAMTGGLVVLVSEDSALAHASGYGTINPLSIDYASRPRLRPRLTLGGSACPRNPWSSGARVSHPRIATHACILTRATSTKAHAQASTMARRSPTHPRP